MNNAESASYASVKGGMNFEGSQESIETEKELREKHIKAMRGKEDMLLSK